MTERGEWRLERVVESHFDRRAIASRAVVKLHAGPQSESVFLPTAVRVGHGPRDGERRKNHPVWAVLHETLVDPIVDEELVWPVAVWIVARDRVGASEDPRLGPGSHLDGARTAYDRDEMHWVIELLQPGSVPGQPVVDDSRHG